MKKNPLTFLLAVSLLAILPLSACAPVDTSQADSAGVSEADASITAETGNIFLDSDADYKPLTNSSKTDVVGKRASISIAKDDALASSAEDFSEFVSEMVDGSDFNWWTIFFDDGTGIVFNGSSVLAPEYGKLSRDGTISEGYGALFLDDDGGYVYKAYED